VKTKSDIRKSSLHHHKIKSLFEAGKRDDSDIELLNKLKADLSDSFSKGKINQFHYANLREELSILYQEIFAKKVDAIDDNKGIDLSYK